MPTVIMDWESRLGRRLRVRDLFILATVVKSGSMAKAAQQLSMTQPAVSGAIANLEHVLRVRLLDRNPRGIEPTFYAEALLKRASAVFDDLTEAAREIEFLADPTAGHVNVGCAESFMAGLLPDIIERLTRKHPKIVVHAEYAEHATTEFRELRDRSTDLVIGRISEATGHDDLKITPLHEEKYYVVASARGPWGRRKKVTLRDLANEPWLHMPKGVIISALIEQAFKRQKLDVPPGRVTSLSMQLRTQLVANAGFLTIMPNTMFHYCAERWQLKALPIDLGIRARNVSIITLKHRTLSPVVELFIEHARAAASALTP
jgi:DNA-binding transcriptional LysR family regulator